MPFQSFIPPHRTLMGPGPSDVSPRVLSALARPTSFSSGSHPNSTSLALTNGLTLLGVPSDRPPVFILAIYLSTYFRNFN